MSAAENTVVCTYSRRHRIYSSRHYPVLGRYASSCTDLSSLDPKYSSTSVFHFFLFLYNNIMCGLEKLGLVGQNWLEHNFPVFLLRTLVVGRRQHSESIEVALDMK